MVAYNLYEQNYYVLSGKKFGADFLIYESNKFKKEDPYSSHSKALIFIDDVDLMEINRVCTIAKKSGYLAKING